MKYSCIILLFLLTIVYTALAAKKSSSSVKCDDESRKKADICADKLWFVGRNSRKYPESRPQMQKHCKQTLNLIKCAKDYTDKCAKGVQKQLANVMLFTVKSNQKTYCSKAVKREEVIQFAACGNSIRDQSTTCMDNFMTSLGKANVMDQKFKIPQACCAFHTMKSCIIKAAQKKGSPSCEDKSMEAYDRYINAMAGNTLNLMCTDYEEDSDKCTKLPPLPAGAKFEKAPTIMVGFGDLLLNV